MMCAEFLAPTGYCDAGLWDDAGTTRSPNVTTPDFPRSFVNALSSVDQRPVGMIGRYQPVGRELDRARGEHVSADAGRQV